MSGKSPCLQAFQLIKIRYKILPVYLAVDMLSFVYNIIIRIYNRRMTITACGNYYMTRGRQTMA